MGAGGAEGTGGCAVCLGSRRSCDEGAGGTGRRALCPGGREGRATCAEGARVMRYVLEAMKGVCYVFEVVLYVLEAEKDVWYVLQVQ